VEGWMGDDENGLDGEGKNERESASGDGHS